MKIEYIEPLKPMLMGHMQPVNYNAVICSGSIKPSQSKIIAINFTKKQILHKYNIW